jgi:hypothetical protein
VRAKAPTVAESKVASDQAISRSKTKSRGRVATLRFLQDAALPNSAHEVSELTALYTRTSRVMRGLTQFILFGPALLGVVSAQYFPPTPENVTVVKSQLQNGVSISYKEVRSSFPSLRSPENKHLLTRKRACSRAFARLHRGSNRTLDMYTFHQGS